MNHNTLEMIERLRNLGISLDDALALRRISMTLHRWHELECGADNGHASYCIARGKRNGKSDFEYDDNGASYLEFHPYNGKTYYRRIPDRETGAKRRLAAIMARYPSLLPYIQGDPRGAALYIVKAVDLPATCPEDGTLDQHYSRGVAVYR